MRRLLSSLSLVSVALWYSPAVAEDEPLRLSRPLAVIEIEVRDGNPRPIMEQVAQAMLRVGYQPRDPIQWGDGFFRASRPESANVEHWVVCWLDWKYNAPGRTLAVFIDYAKFKRYAGSGWRKEPTSDIERSNELKQVSVELQRLAHFIH